MWSDWSQGGHQTAHSLGMPRRWFARRYLRDPVIETRWGNQLESAKNRALAVTLDDPEELERFRSGARLPRGFGFALDERVVEIPWVAANLPAEGPVLDAGSALNHPVVLQRLMPRIEGLTVVTFTEEDRHPELGPNYASADLRELPFADGEFAAVACISTLDHVGMDNSDYGAVEPRSDDPDAEVALALAELRRVLRPGGRLLLTVPYGRAEDHGWCRQFNRAGIERIVDGFGDGDPGIQVYGYSLRGWNRSTLRRSARARYRDPKAQPRPQPDCAYAARAVACLTLTRAS